MPDIFGRALWETKDGGARLRALIAASIAVAALATPSIARAGEIDAAGWSNPARARASWSIASCSSTSRSSAWWNSSATAAGLAFLSNAAHHGYGES